MIIELLIFGGAYVISKILAEEQQKKSYVKPLVTPPEKLISFVGATGVGKSSTINSLLGKEVCKVGVTHGTTVDSQRHQYRNNFYLQDTPGIMDIVDYLPHLWSAIEKSCLVIFTGKGQLYQPELAFLKQIHEKQTHLNKIAGKKQRGLSLYINHQDIAIATMTSKNILLQREAIYTQIEPYIPRTYIAFGDAKPTKLNDYSDTGKTELETMIWAYLTKEIQP